MRNTFEGYGTLQAVDDYEFEFNEGREAFIEALTEDDCPYEVGKQPGQNRSREAWLAGFYLAKKARRGYSAVEKQDAQAGLNVFESRPHTEIRGAAVPKPFVPPKKRV